MNNISDQTTTIINQMTKLSDMGKFPWHVHLGASLNIIFTIWLTRVIYLHTGGDLFYLPLFSAFIISANLLPVIFLRLFRIDSRPYPEIGKMNFFLDQHRFSSWVYAIASANMFFWITTSWCIFSIYKNPLALLQVFAFFITFVPAWRSFCKKFF